MLNRLKTFLFKSDLEYVAEKVSLADVGEGIYISAWHYDIPKPTIAELLKISEKGRSPHQLRLFTAISTYFGTA